MAKAQARARYISQRNAHLFHQGSASAPSGTTLASGSSSEQMWGPRKLGCHALLRADAHRGKLCNHHADFPIMSQHSPASALSDGQDIWSDESGNEEGEVGSNKKRRRTGTDRPISVSCETCMSHATRFACPLNCLLSPFLGKSRKVKCDRTRPSCGW
jgi:hypothetical protein